MKKEKQKVVVWMSRDSQRTKQVEFWSKRPRFRKATDIEAGNIDFEMAYNPDNKDFKVSACNQHYANKVLEPFNLSKKGLVKLTITVEQIE